MGGKRRKSPRTDDAQKHNVKAEVVRVEIDDGEANAAENDQQKDEDGKARVKHGKDWPRIGQMRGVTIGYFNCNLSPQLIAGNYFLQSASYPNKSQQILFTNYPFLCPPPPLIIIICCREQIQWESHLRNWGCGGGETIKRSWKAFRAH